MLICPPLESLHMRIDVHVVPELEWEQALHKDLKQNREEANVGLSKIKKNTHQEQFLLFSQNKQN